MNPDVTLTESVTQPLVDDYVESISIVLIWAVPFFLALCITVYAAAFFLRLLFAGVPKQ